jgi:response regulator RpfG family c-di-GMP phosphodiesterase
MMEALKINVLYLDDEQQNLQSFNAAFRKHFNVFIASSTAEAEEILEENEIHVAISDHKMPGATGVDFFESLIEKNPDVIRILVTAYTDLDIVIEAINRGQVYRYFTKPWERDEILGTVYGAFKIYKDRQDAARLSEQLKETNEQLEFMLRQRLIS